MNKKTNNGLKILVVWTTFHLFGFILAGTNIDFFNSQTSVNDDKFWPFVSIIQLPTTVDRVIIDEAGQIAGLEKVEVGIRLNGIFYYYESTELIFYLILGFAVFSIYYLNNNGKKAVTDSK